MDIIIVFVFGGLQEELLGGALEVGIWALVEGGLEPG